MIIDRLRTKSKTAVTESVFTIFNYDITILSISFAFRRNLYSWVFFHESIGIRTLSAFYCHGIVIYRHVAVFDKYILYYVEVDCIGGRSFGIIGLSEAVNMATNEFYIL